MLFVITSLVVLVATIPTLLISQEQIDNEPSRLFNSVASLVQEKYSGQNVLLISYKADWFSPLKIGSVTYRSFAGNQRMFLDMLAAGQLQQILLIQFLSVPGLEVQGGEARDFRLPTQTVLARQSDPETVIRIARVVQAKGS